MNDKYLPTVDEFSDVVDEMLWDFQGLFEAMSVHGLSDKTFRICLLDMPKWKAFCKLVANGLEIKSTVGRVAILYAREYNQGNQGTADVRT